MADDVFLSMRKAILKANRKILEIYQNGFQTQLKSDSSPVTDADLASDAIIRKELEKYTDIGFLSEEETDDLSRLSRKRIFVVDPLDGTQDFVNHDDSFAVNLALVEDSHPVIAFLGFPFYQAYCYAIKGKGSYYVDENGKETRLFVSDRLDGLIFLCSKTHELPSEAKVRERHADRIAQIRYEGASVKAYLLASGQGDACVRYTDKTKEWDICAPELIVTEAGGIFEDTLGNPFVYNRKDVYNRQGYCMFNRKENEILLK